MDETSDLRRDLHPLLHHALYRRFSQTVYQLTHDYSELSNENLATRYICSKVDGNEFIKDPKGYRSLALQLSRLFDKANDTRYFEEEMLQMVVSIFRVSEESFLRQLKEIVINETNGGAYLHEEKMDHKLCVRLYKYGRFSKDAVVFSTAIMFTLGLSDPTLKTPLGNIINWELIEAYKKRHSIIEEHEAIHKFTHVDSNIMGDLTELSMQLLFRYLEGDKLSKVSYDLNQCKWYNVGLMKYSNDHVVQFCSANNTWACCKLEKEISQDLSTVMKVMKYMLAPPSANILEQSERNELQSIKIDQFGYIKGGYYLKNTRPVVLACKYGNQTLTSNCNMFRKLYTTGGIGYTFNNAPFTQLFKNTTDNLAFLNEMYLFEETNDHDQPKAIVANGQRFSFEFVLGHDKKLIDNAVYRFPKLMIHDPDTVADARNAAIVLEPGMAYDIAVTPSVTVTDNNGLQLKPDQRKCLAKSESGSLNSFGQYTQSACLFECQLKIAAEKCNCTAWDYPRLNSDVDLCWYKVAKSCFKTQMDSFIDSDDCDCPNDCSSVEYSVAIQARPIKLKKYSTNCESLYDDPTDASVR